MTGAVNAVASIDILVERLATQLAVNTECVITTVGAVSTVTSSIEQLLVKVAFVRLASTVAR